MAFAAVESRTANNATGGAATNGNNAATSHSVVLPGTVSAGSLLIVAGRTTGAGTVSFPAGWVVDQSTLDASDDMAFWAYRSTLAAGTEAGTSITVSHVNSNKMVAASYSITGAANPATRPPQASTIAVGTTVTVSPTTCTPTGGSKDYLWLAVGSADGEQTSPPGTIPTSYGNSAGWSTGTAAATTTNAVLFVATRNLTAASEDPGNWSLSATPTGWTSWTIAIHPATAVTPTGLTRTRAQGSLTFPPRPNGLARTRAQGSPTATRSHRSSALGALTVSPAKIGYPASLVRTRAQGVPIVSPKLLPAALARTRALGTTVVTQITNVTPAAQAHTRAQGSPVVSSSIVPSALIRSRAQGSTSVFLNFTLTPAALTRTRALGSPAVGPTLLPSAQSHSRAQGAPVLVSSHRRRALGTLVVSATAPAPASLVRTRAQGTPVVHPTLRPAAQAHSRAQGAPTIGSQSIVAPAALTRTRAQGAPIVSPKVVPASLSRTRAIGTIVVQRGHRIRALGNLTVSSFDPNLASPASLVHTRAQGAAAAFFGHRRRALGSPTLGGIVVSPASNTHTRAQGAVTVSTTLSFTVNTESLVHTRGVSSVTVRAGHRIRALGALTVSVDLTADVTLSGLTSTGSVPLLMGMPERQRLVGDPAVAIFNPNQVSPASLVRSRSLGSPGVTADSFASPSALTHTRAIGNVRLVEAHRYRAIGPITVTITSATVSPASLLRTRGLGTPTLTQVTAGSPGALTHTRALGATSISSGPVGLTHTRALGDIRTNVTLYPAGLVHVRFASGATLYGPGVSTGNYNRMLTGIGL